MPSKKKKYNARFPAGRIKKIMQTDEEVGKVAQAVPIIIWPTPRTLELFVESLLKKALHVTTTRNSKTLSPSHVKQCILAESRFDFLKDLVKNIPDVSAAEEKELLSGENSPNSSRYADFPSNSRGNTGTSSAATPRAQATTEKDYDSSCSSNSDTPLNYALRGVKRQHSTIESTPTKIQAIEQPEREIMDLTKKPQPAITPAIIETRTQRTVPNFYQETLTDLVETPEPPVEVKQPPAHSSVIQINPKYLTTLPSTSNSNNSNNNRTVVVNNNTDQSIKPMPKLVLDPSVNYSKQPLLSSPLVRSPLTPNPMYHVDLLKQTPLISANTPTTPILNIDFTKNLSQPEIKFVETSPSATGGNKQQGARSRLVSSVGKKVASLPSPKLHIDLSRPSMISRQISSQISNTVISDAAMDRTPNSENPMEKLSQPPMFYKVNTDIDRSNSDNLEIDEDYDT